MRRENKALLTSTVVGAIAAGMIAYCMPKTEEELVGDKAQYEVFQKNRNELVQKFSKVCILEKDSKAKDLNLLNIVLERDNEYQRIGLQVDEEWTCRHLLKAGVRTGTYIPLFEFK